MAVLFGGNGTDSLATMWYNTFSRKVVTSSSFVTPERLPPTESATKFHCRRHTTRSWPGLESKMTLMLWTEDGACRMTSWSQLCHKWLLLQIVSWRSFIATAPLLAGHSAVLAEDTDCHALLRADHANFRTVTIRTIDFFPDELEDEDN